MDNYQGNRRGRSRSNSRGRSSSRGRSNSRGRDNNGPQNFFFSGQSWSRNKLLAFFSTFSRFCKSLPVMFLVTLMSYLPRCLRVSTKRMYSVFTIDIAITQTDEQKVDRHFSVAFLENKNSGIALNAVDIIRQLNSLSSAINDIVSKIVETETVLSIPSPADAIPEFRVKYEVSRNFLITPNSLAKFIYVDSITDSVTLDPNVAQTSDE